MAQPISVSGDNERDIAQLATDRAGVSEQGLQPLK